MPLCQIHHHGPSHGGRLQATGSLTPVSQKADFLVHVSAALNHIFINV